MSILPPERARVIITDPSREVVEIRDGSDRVISVIEPVGVAASGGGSGGGVFVHVEPVPKNIYDVQHDFGYYPAVVGLFSLDYATQYDEFSVQHLDVNSLRLSLDLATAGVVLIPK